MSIELNIVVKILIILMILVGLDLIVQSAVGGGLVVIQGNQYSLLELLEYLFGVLVAFGGLILHLVTHLDQLQVFFQGEIPTDLRMLGDGILALVTAITGSVVDLLLHLLKFPFEFIGSTLEANGIPFGVKIGIANLGHFAADFRTLSFQVKFGDAPYPGIQACAFGVCSGWFLVLNNGFGFSMLGTGSSSLLFTLDVVSIFNGISTGDLGLAAYHTWSIEYDPVSFYVVAQDYVWTKPVTGYFEMGINSVAVFNALFGQAIQEISLSGVLNALLSLVYPNTLEYWKSTTLDYLLTTG